MTCRYIVNLNGVYWNPLTNQGVFYYNKCRMNFKIKGYDGDSKIHPNVPANRGGWKPGISRKFPNITPELQPPKQLYQGVRADADPALEDTIYELRVSECRKSKRYIRKKEVQVWCNRWLKREYGFRPIAGREPFFISWQGKSLIGSKESAWMIYLRRPAPARRKTQRTRKTAEDAV